jgi:hypothetical protein
MKHRFQSKLALLAGAFLLSSAMIPHAAHADSKKEKTLKTGAVVLGAIGAYYAVKGKTLKGALAGAAGYYAYKKSKDAKNERSAGDVYPEDRYGDDRYGDDRYSDDVYPNDVRTRNTSTRNDDFAYEDAVTEDDVYPTGRTASTRNEHATRSERVTRQERYSDDLGYVGLDEKTATSKEATGPETVLK